MTQSTGGMSVAVPGAVTGDQSLGSFSNPGTDAAPAVTSASCAGCKVGAGMGTVAFFNYD